MIGMRHPLIRAILNGLPLGEATRARAETGEAPRRHARLASPLAEAWPSRAVRRLFNGCGASSVRLPTAHRVGLATTRFVRGLTVVELPMSIGIARQRAAQLPILVKSLGVVWERKLYSRLNGALHEANRRSYFEEEISFLAQWSRNPFRVGALLPSGQTLADTMAAQVELDRPGVIVELGAGTGSVTRALLRAGLAPDRLVVIERDDRLYAWLVVHFPGVRVVRGDAADIARLLADLGVERINAIVSSLPLRAMTVADKDVILRQSVRQLGEGGVFVQFSYGRRCPVPNRFLSQPHMERRMVARVWRNLPPARVWRFVRREAGRKGRFGWAR